MVLRPTVFWAGAALLSSLGACVDWPPVAHCKAQRRGAAVLVDVSAAIRASSEDAARDRLDELAARYGAPVVACALAQAIDLSHPRERARVRGEAVLRRLGTEIVIPFGEPWP